MRSWLQKMAWLTILLLIALLLVAVTIINTGASLFKNYRAARTIGVPIRIIPISPLNPFWVLVDRRVLSFSRRLPFGDNSFTRYNWRGWEVEDRYRSHTEMGDIWVLVTPFKNWVYINDPEALMSVYRRGSDFPRPVFINGMYTTSSSHGCVTMTLTWVETLEILNVFGPNISTVRLPS